MKIIAKYSFIIILLVNCFIATKYILENYSSKSLYTDLSESYNLDEHNSNFQDKANENFNEMFQKNNDFVGWITIPNTMVDYPVVQTDNNTVYLERDFIKRENHGGCIFIDSSNKVTSNIKDGDKNIVFYGHNMKNGTMFATLEKFKDAYFFNNNRYVFFTTDTNKFKFEIFSVYVESASNNYRKNVFSSHIDYTKFLDNIIKKSINKRNLSINENDTIITLSTCSYEFDDARFVVHAKLVQ